MDSGLNSMVLASNNEMVLLPVNEPTFGTKRQSQIQVHVRAAALRLMVSTLYPSLYKAFWDLSCGKATAAAGGLKRQDWVRTCSLLSWCPPWAQRTARAALNDFMRWLL